MNNLSISNALKKTLLFSTLTLGFLFFSIFIGKVSAHELAITSSSDSIDVNLVESNINTLTKDLLSLETTYEKSISQDSLSSLVHTAKDRQALLKLLADNSPESLLRISNLSEKKSSFPIEVQSYIEEKLSAKGMLEIIHGHYLNDREKSYYAYNLKSDKGDLELKLDIENFRYKTDDILEVKGLLIDNYLITNSDEFDFTLNKNYSINLIEESAATVTAGDYPILVIPINFQNEPTQTMSKEGLTDFIFGNHDNSVKAHYTDNSHGKLNLTGEVMDWYTLPYSSIDENNPCNLTRWSGNARDYWMSNPNFNLSEYRHFVYVITQNTGCPWGGLGSIGGDNTHAWIFSPFDRFIFTHELGHNLGLNHASYLMCNQVTIDEYSKCTKLEYGDSSSTMGSAEHFGHNGFNGPEKGKLGWIKEQEITQTGNYVVYPIEENNNEVKLLSFRKNDTGEKYYLSYRKSVGINSNILPVYTTGLSIHVNRPGVGYTAYNTLLLDSHPADRSHYDAPMVNGQTFYDSRNKVKVTQLSNDGGVINVRVEIEQTPESSLLTSWSKTGDMPFTFSEVTGVDDKGNVYIIDTNSSENTESAVISGKMNSDGTIGEWKTLNPIPYGLFTAQSIFVKDYIYVIGGYNEVDGSSSKVFRARLNGDGYIGNWEEMQALPIGIGYHALVANGKYIYIVGGSSTADVENYYLNSIYRSEILADGSISNFVKLQTTLPKVGDGYRSVIINNKIYIFGGGNGNFDSYSQKIYRGDITESGEITNMVEEPVILPTKLLDFGISAYKNYIIISGGRTSNGAKAEVYLSKVNADGTLSNWFASKNLNNPIFFHDTLVHNKNLYSFSGIIKVGSSHQNYYSFDKASILMPDLAVTDVQRSINGYRVKVCNLGNINRSETFSLNSTNINASKSFTTPSLQTPDAGQCVETVISCQDLGSNCNDSIKIEFNADSDNTVEEFEEVSNNVINKTFAQLYTDLTAKNLTRDSLYYTAEICNNGQWKSDAKFLVKLTNTATGKSFTSNPNYPFSVPEIGQCMKTGGFTCGLISAADCNDTVNIKTEVNITNTVEEVIKTNNQITKNFVASLADLTVEQITRDRTYYKAYVCNRGTASSTSTFTIKLTNVTNGKSFISNVNYPYSVPQPGQCFWTGGFTCGLIGSTCTDSISVRVDVDNGLKVGESNESNNSKTQSYSTKIYETTDPVVY